ncbi:phosphodiester glycosidase family protein [Selenomonas sp. F0473]|uniref:phosphodiester glycosidase family protein n=1 Tax=Selenomonas sp. F0473 TaxID=999423 RepID=UPI00029E67E5|nr:phosphodiester glycosidase family protein [Selenomonas sp. F0473]EKU72253.1 hypothetical protein HMPREF9161_00938 [Selenomonas sp. F0473]
MHVFLKKIFVFAAALMFAATSYVYAAAGMTGLRTSSGAERDRIVFDLTEMPIYHVNASEDGRELTLDFADVDASKLKRAAIRTKRIQSVSYEKRNGHFYVTVMMAKGMTYRIGNLTNPFRVFLDIAPTGAEKPASKPAPLPAPTPVKPGGDNGSAKPGVSELPLLREKQLAPGLVQKTYVYEDADGRVTAYFVEADPNRFSVRPALARGYIPGRQTVSGIARATNAAAAINASYFALNGELIGVTKIDGLVVGTTYFDRSAFGVMPDGSFIFGVASYNGTVKLDQTTLPVSGVNTERGENNLIVYNRAYGRTTGTNPYGLEYVVRNGRVTEINTNDSAIPSDGYVVSVHGSSMDGFASAGVRVGDPAVLAEHLGGAFDRAVQVLGAGPRLVADGSAHVTAGEEQFPGDIRYGRAPRSAVGVTKAGKILFAVVDGRQSHSHGLTLTEFAQLLVQFGVQNAVNLDGGGSSELYAGGAVLNSPSDGSERAVGSALILQKK